jgi:hypothetical protein
MPFPAFDDPTIPFDDPRTLFDGFTMPLNLDGDWAFMDGTEGVTLYRKQPGETFDTGTVIPKPFALRVTAQKRAGGDPRLAPQESLTWLLCPSKAGTPVAKVDDVIQDGTGARWQVDLVRICPLGSTWHLDTTLELTT